MYLSRVQAKEVPPAEGSTMGVKDVDAKKPLVKPSVGKALFSASWPPQKFHWLGDSLKKNGAKLGLFSEVKS